MPEQLKGEFLNVLDLTMFVIRKLGFDSFTAQISLRDPENKEKYIGSDDVWEKPKVLSLKNPRGILLKQLLYRRSSILRF
jgi:threonyl-tRNA synthetase